MRNSLLNYVWRPLFGPPDVATYNAIGRKLMLCKSLFSSFSSYFASRRHNAPG